MLGLRSQQVSSGSAAPKLKAAAVVVVLLATLSAGNAAHAMNDATPSRAAVRHQATTKRPVLRSYANQLALQAGRRARLTDQPGVLPSQPYSSWTWSSANHTDIGQKLSIQTATPGATYYYADQFIFGSGGDQGYIGLQDGSWPSGGRAAIFSIWSANAASGANCATFGREGTGWSCRVDAYKWVVGRTYQLRVTKDGVDSGGTWYKGTVRDTATGVLTTMGRIRVPLAWSGMQGHVSWTEWFGAPVASCQAIVASKVRWTYPTAQKDTVRITGHNTVLGPYWEPPRPCVKGTVTTDVTGAVIQDIHPI